MELKKGTKVIWGKRYEKSEVGVLKCDLTSNDKGEFISLHHVGFPVYTSYGIRYAHYVEKYKD